jgi:hypothetical protein
MGNNTKTPVVIDGTEYQFEELTPEQQTLVNHVADLDRKLASTRFNLDQLQVGRNAFMSMLTESLKAAETTQAAETEPKAE